MYLHQLPRMVPVVALVILLVLGALLPPALAAIPIGLAVLFLAWLSYLSWPAIATPAKLTRLSIIAFLVGFAVFRFLG